MDKRKNAMELVDQKSDGRTKEGSVSNAEYSESLSWFYNPVFLPGMPTTIMVRSTYPFLTIGRFLPVLDFISDIASAGISC